MYQVELNYYNPANKSVVTDSGFRYLDTKPVITGTKEIFGDNEVEIFEQFYKLNNELRYCNGSYYRFISNDWDLMYKQWIKSDDYKNKAFSLYYGENGIVD